MCVLVSYVLGSPEDWCFDNSALYSIINWNVYCKVERYAFLFRENRLVVSLVLLFRETGNFGETFYTKNWNNNLILQNVLIHLLR